MGRAAIRYAKAVLSLAQDKKVTKDVQADMQTIIATVDSSNDLRMLLSSPLVKEEAKLASLKQIFGGTGELTKKLFDTLSANKRADLLQGVAKEYITLYDRLNNTQVAKVTTAVPLNKEMSTKILAKVKELTGNEATLENTVDESIIGGFILRVGDLQYNASVLNKLTTLRRELSN